MESHNMDLPVIISKWHPIPNSNGYEISYPELEVRGPNGDITVSETHSAGYVTVRINGKNELHHRVVGTVFVPNPNRKPLINHKDGNKTNNAPSNLEWCTFSENARHAFRCGLRDDNNYVILSNKEKKLGFISQAEAAAYLDRNPASFSEALARNGNGMFYCGYTVYIVDSDGRKIHYIRKKSPKCYKIEVCTDDTSIICNSIRHAAKVTGINAKRIRRCIIDKTKFNGHGFKLSA